MNKFPSNKALTITFIVIIIYLVIDFNLKGEKDFFQLNYNWNNLKTYDLYESTTVDSVSYNYLSIVNNQQKIIKTLSTDDTYVLDNKYYFRCSAINISEEHAIFKGVYWINNVPQKIKLVPLAKTNLSIKQSGDRKVCMIGDSQWSWLEGKYTRKEIAKKLSNITFVGNHKDVFGYPYEVELLNTTENILNNLDSIPAANTYIIFVGAHEENNNETINNLNIIIASLLKNKAQVFLIIPPKCKENMRLLYSIYDKNPNIIVINPIQKSNKNDTILMDDGTHLNLLGHQTLTKRLIEKLKNTEK